MNFHVDKRLFLAAAVLGALAVFAAAFFVALAVRSAVADPSGPLPNPGHAWTDIQGHGDDADACYVSTQSDQAFEVRVNGNRALRLEPHATSPNLIGGYSGNTVTSAVYGATISGGGSSAETNRVWDNYGTVGGGGNNQAAGGYATVGGGDSNTAGGYATVGGGESNIAGSSYTTVAGGYYNHAGDVYSAVGGGESNVANDSHATVGGGYWNQAYHSYATIAGGSENTTGAPYATVGGGTSNQASGLHSTVGGGWENVAESDSDTVGGGHHNTASGWLATVGGGEYNTANDQATVGGGTVNHATGFSATIGGGGGNTASGGVATVGGGEQNTASGEYATVPGGGYNAAAGDYSFAAGRRAKANNDGCFVWGDSTNADFTCSTDNRFQVRADGGVYLYSKSDLSTGVYMDNGDTDWTGVSDRNLKENFTPVEGQEVLASLAEMPITTWNLKGQDASIQHMGPVAQDFYAAFGLGYDELHITGTDPDGVALAAIQGLYELSQEQAERIDTLEARVAALEGGAPPEGGSESLLASIMPAGWFVLAGLVVGGLVVVQRRRAGGRS